MSSSPHVFHKTPMENIETVFMEGDFHFVLFMSFSGSESRSEFRFTQVLDTDTLMETHFKHLIYGVRGKAASLKIFRSSGTEKIKHPRLADTRDKFVLL